MKRFQPIDRTDPGPQEDTTMSDVPTTKAFLIQWSEGEPTLVLADDFNQAVETFVTAMADEDCSMGDVRRWIQSVTIIADTIISARKGY